MNSWFNSQRRNARSSEVDVYSLSMAALTVLLFSTSVLGQDEFGLPLSTLEQARPMSSVSPATSREGLAVVPPPGVPVSLSSPMAAGSMFSPGSASPSHAPLRTIRRLNSFPESLRVATRDDGEQDDASAADDASDERDSAAVEPGKEEADEGKAKNTGDKHEPFMSPTVNGSYSINGLDATPITKRLFGFAIDEDEELSPITRVDLGLPDELPHYDHRAGRVDFRECDFGPLAETPYCGYDPNEERKPYYGKTAVRVERPWVELGRGLYLPGPIPPSSTWLGEKNLVSPRFLVFGDLRTGVAYNDNGANDAFVHAVRLNLSLDLQITATERIAAFVGPLDRGVNFTRFSTENGGVDFFEEFDRDFDNLFFEGDLGAMLGGAMDIYPPFDMPIAIGLLPMLYQNGNWILDNFLGAAVTIPAKNSPKLLWSNYDVTFFTGIDEVNSLAFPGDDSQAHIYGVHTNIDCCTGYLEVGYAYLEDQQNQGLSYHNLGVSFSRRYFQRLSNSVRWMANVGQDPVAGNQTADGQLILIENSWITSDYTHVVPYLNLFAGFDRPQSVARAAGAGGVLLNTGINFETDGLTGYPTLDANANNTYGGAVGLNLIGPDFSWQLVTEFAVVAVHGDRADRSVPGDQYACGVRFQKPITNAWLVRLDSMYGVRDELADVFGTRAELRYKF